LFFTAFPVMTSTRDNMFAVGDMVAVTYTTQATHRGPFLGVTATGRHIAFTGLSMYRLPNGRIAERWDALDTAAIMGQREPVLD
jgi:predicted ester cyclase